MRVLLFAQLKTLAGQPELEFNLREDSTLSEFWEQLLSAHPVLKEQRPLVRVACNSEFATTETRFLNSDDVALIPPVSGG